MEDLRHRIRFLPEATEIAIISFDENDLENYHSKEHHISGQYVGLIENESHTGCSLVLLNLKNDIDRRFEPETVCVAVVGKLSPMRARIRWRKKVDDVIYRVGIELLD